MREEPSSTIYPPRDLTVPSPAARLSPTPPSRRPAKGHCVGTRTPSASPEHHSFRKLIGSAAWLSTTKPSHRPLGTGPETSEVHLSNRSSPGYAPLSIRSNPDRSW